MPRGCPARSAPRLPRLRPGAEPPAHPRGTVPSEEPARRRAGHGRRQAGRAGRAVDLEPDPVGIGEEERGRLGAFAMRHDPVVAGRHTARAELGLDRLHCIERRELERQVMEPRMPRLEPRPALLPECQEQPAAGAEERKPLPIVVGGLDEVEVEDLLVERERPVEVGDGEADMAGGDHGRGGRDGHGDLLVNGTGTAGPCAGAANRRLSVVKSAFASDKFQPFICQSSFCRLYSPPMRIADPPPFVFVGNHRALDFVNTEVAVEGVPRDLLGELDDVTAWLVQAGALDRASARTALARWGGRRRRRTANCIIILNITQIFFMVIICWLNVERKSYRDRIIILLLKGRILKN